MALENISNVPEVCSESLLEHFIFKIFLGETPQTPLRTFPWDARGVFVALCPTGPPMGKNPGSAPVFNIKLRLFEIRYAKYHLNLINSCFSTLSQ